VIMAAIRGMLRYGKGGPHQVGSARGPFRSGGMTYGDGISNYRKDRGSSYGAIQSQFRIDWDAENFKRALNRVGVDGDRYVKDILLELAREAVGEAREGLKDMARLHGDAREPDNIYNRVGKNLEAVEVPGSNFIRVHTGDNLRSAEFGQLSRSRPSGNLSKIVATGFDEHDYGNLPIFVKSSRKFAKSSGFEMYSTYGMKQAEKHPGMERYDYMLYIEDYIMSNFIQDIKHHMKFMGEQYGFSTSLGYKEGL
jgi:hypothetical protein